FNRRSASAQQAAFLTMHESLDTTTRMNFLFTAFRKNKLRYQRFSAIFVAVLLANFLGVSVCLGQAVIESFTGESSVSIIGTGTTYGFSFTVANQDISVSQLGFWDDSSDGLVDAHDVGLWDGSQTLLAQATIPAGTVAPLNNSFRYVSVTPVQLSANTTYYLGAYYPDNSGDNVAANATTTATVVGSGVIKGDARNTTSAASGLQFVDAPFVDANDGLYGPNAQFAPVPEPAAYGTAFGLLAVVFAILKRRIWIARV